MVCLKGFVKGNKQTGLTCELWAIIRGSEQEAVEKREKNLSERFLSGSVAKDMSLVRLVAQQL